MHCGPSIGERHYVCVRVYAAVSADAQSVSVTVLSANWYSAQIPEWKTLTDEELKALLGGKVTLTLGIDAGVVDVSAFPMYEPSAQ